MFGEENMAQIEDLIQFKQPLCSNPTSSGTIPPTSGAIPLTLSTEGTPSKIDFKWSVNHTKFLLDLYAKYKDDVGTFKIRNAKALWEKIANELRLLQINVNSNHCLNRWRVVERSFKKFTDNQSKTGRGRRFFEYKEEMEAIFKNKVNLRPEYLLGVERNSETVEPQIEDEEPRNENVAKNQTESKENVRTNLRKNIRVNVTKQLGKERRLTTAEKLRKDKKEYYINKLDIEREKLEEIKRRNNIMEERNNILKNNKCNCHF
ncbi:hypothetical protein ABEB36_010714 [Hypothenemus hampei]|uniref:Myb/SANT-like DNA-binding domain-containing protein n=1 Tax=Hypothenemus hampei TaxID=57062 RepID=A0ABD1ECT2_HYPHA